MCAELMLRRPWFQPQTPQGLHSAPTEIGTLREIFGALGTPTPESWPDADTLPNYMRFTACPGQPLRAAFPQACRPTHAHVLRAQDHLILKHTIAVNVITCRHGVACQYWNRGFKLADVPLGSQELKLKVIPRACP